jgi:hypothetical protein
MPPVTTRHRPKSFSWSYSKLKNYETCPKKHYHLDVIKDIKEEESENLSYGNTVHTVMHHYLAKGTIMPPVLEPTLKPWADKVKAGKGDLLVEQKYAITKDFGPCDWFAPVAWYRGIGDVVRVNGPVALIVDWKTGKIIEDSVQLALMAQCVFAHFPEVQVVKSLYVWLKEDAETSEVFKRADMPGIWNNILPRVRQLEEAYKTTSFPAQPSGLCRKWCPVKSCPHFGVG